MRNSRFWAGGADPPTIRIGGPSAAAGLRRPRVRCREAIAFRVVASSAASPKGRDKVAGGNAPGKRAPNRARSRRRGIEFGVASGSSQGHPRDPCDPFRVGRLSWWFTGGVAPGYPTVPLQGTRPLASAMASAAALLVRKWGLAMCKDEEISGPAARDFGLASQGGWECN